MIPNQPTHTMTPKQKRDYWDAVKAELPEIADFIKLISDKFGTPESVRIKLQTF